MSRFRYILYTVIGIPFFLILIWLVAIPNSYIETAIQDAISNNGTSAVNASVEGLKKGIFFTVYADSIDLDIDNVTALTITDISCKINPLYFINKQFAFSIEGKIGAGDLRGSFKLPEYGNLRIEGVDIMSVPYLSSAGLEGSGLISSEIKLLNNSIDIIFNIPDADISASLNGMPLPVNSFHKIQGSLNLIDNIINIKSISLDGDKGYARLKGDITNGIMNLALELMPLSGKLDSFESALIRSYQRSAGYYIIPIKGPLLKLPSL